MPEAQYQYDRNTKRYGSSYASNWKDALQYQCGGDCSCFPSEQCNSALSLIYAAKYDPPVEKFTYPSPNPSPGRYMPSMLKTPWPKSCPFQNTNICLGNGAANSRTCNMCAGKFSPN